MMPSVLLRAGSMPIFVLQILFSFYFLLRGHSSPGGGFIAGLLAAASFALHAIAVDVASARALLRVPSQTLVSLGLGVAVGSGLLAVLIERPFMTGVWGGSVLIPVIGEVKLGTPLLFDIGVYFTVLGMTTFVVFSLFERGGPRAEPETREPRGPEVVQ